jgi:hypothetical protein
MRFWNNPILNQILEKTFKKQTFAENIPAEIEVPDDNDACLR